MTDVFTKITKLIDRVDSSNEEPDPQLTPGGFELDGERVTIITGRSLNGQVDVLPSIKRRLGQFMSDMTQGKQRLEGTFEPKANRIPIDNKTEDRVTENNKAYDASFKPSPGATNLPETLSRGSSPDPSRLADGHTLLPEIQVESLNHPNVSDIVLGRENPSTKTVRRYTSAVLSQNRFTATNQMSRELAEDKNVPNLYNPEMNMTSRQPGVYDKDAETFYSHRRLAHIGTILTARASGEIGSTADRYNPDDAGAIAKAILPSAVQLGVDRVELKKLDVLDVLSELTKENNAAENFNPSPNKSWGQLNNPLDTYSGLTSLGMIALSLALVAATVVAFEAILLILKVAPVRGEGPAAAKHPDGRYVYGHYAAKLEGKKSGLGAALGKLVPSVSKLLGIRPTLHPYDKALEIGLYTFFGLEPPSGGVLNTVVNTTTSALGSSVATPGYNVVAARNIARSVVLLGDKFKELGRSANLISGAQNALSLFEELRDSKLIAAMNVFALLGDAILEGDKEIVETLDGAREYRSKIDSIKDDAAASAHSKGRLRGGTLAWAGYRSPTALLIPKSISDYSLATMISKSDIAAPNVLSILQNPRTKTSYVAVDATTGENALGSGARLSQADVESIESSLDAEYMPFYFHDLRTNEIIAFHAFLNSLTDDYTPQWESSTGYGRVDPVMIYKSTGRKIAFNFWIAALDNDDHAEMWTKINKLVTLIYPQYSQGRIVETDTKYKFIQPFSQIMTSSPLIRLRIGDVVKSNYSKFNLSRLFGAGDTSSGLSIDGKGSQIQTNVNNANGAVKKFSEAIQRARTTMDAKYTFLLKTDGQVPASANPSPISLPVATGKGGPPRNLIIPGNYRIYYKVEAIKNPTGVASNVDGYFTAKLSPLSNSELSTIYGERQYDVSDAEKYYKDFGLADAIFVFRESEVTLAPSSVAQIARESGLSNTTVEENMQALNTFLSSENNALVRAFDSTKGRGLAGVIDSLNFDWLDNTTWDITPHSRAPMMCKVTVSFTPIHDISPGIDHMGYNRAPIYPVSAQYSEPPQTSTKTKSS